MGIHCPQCGIASVSGCISTCHILKYIREYQHGGNLAVYPLGISLGYSQIASDCSDQIVTLSGQIRSDQIVHIIERQSDLKIPDQSDYVGAAWPSHRLRGCLPHGPAGRRLVLAGSSARHAVRLRFLYQQFRDLSTWWSVPPRMCLGPWVRVPLRARFLVKQVSPFAPCQGGAGHAPHSKLVRWALQAHCRVLYHAFHAVPLPPYYYACYYAHYFATLHFRRSHCGCLYM